MHMNEMFEGLTFTLARIASPRFNVTHTVLLPTQSEQGYQVSLDYRTENGVCCSGGIELLDMLEY
jgi:hypothetical protein